MFLPHVTQFSQLINSRQTYATYLVGHLTQGFITIAEQLAKCHDYEIFILAIHVSKATT